MSENTAKRREELYVVEIDGVKNSEHRTFIEALKCGMELKRCYPRSDVKLHDAHENAPHEAHHPMSKRTWENGRSSIGGQVAKPAASAYRRGDYWNATSAKLRSLRECKRSQSWALSFSSALNPISRCWPTRWR